MRGRGTSVCLESQRQFHHMHLDRIFCTSPIIKEPSNAGKRKKGKQTKAHLWILSLGKQIQPNTGCFQSLESTAVLTEVATCWVAWTTRGSVGSHFLGTSNSTTQQRGHWFRQTSSSFLFLQFLTTVHAVLLSVTWLGRSSQYCCGRDCAPLQFCVLLSPCKFHSQNLDLLWASPFCRVWSVQPALVGWCLLCQERGASVSLLWWGHAKLMNIHQAPT